MNPAGGILGIIISFSSLFAVHALRNKGPLVAIGSGSALSAGGSAIAFKSLGEPLPSIPELALRSTVGPTAFYFAEKAFGKWYWGLIAALAAGGIATYVFPPERG